jgi:hypothetical protein
LEKSDFSNRAQGAQEIRFFWKNRISQTVPKAPKKSDFLEKSDFSNRVPKRAQEMKNKSGAQEIQCPRNPIFWT